MEKCFEEREIWRRVTGSSEGGAPEQATVILGEIRSVRSRILTLRRISGGSGLLGEERETLERLLGLYVLLTGNYPKIGDTDPLPGKNRGQLLRELLRSAETSSGRIWAMEAHATGNIRWELRELGDRERLLWRKLLGLLGRQGTER